MKDVKRFLMIGAHPDDADVQFGGTASLLVQAGHAVKFVSLTNGNCGHYEQSGEVLAKRRYAETQASKAVSGISEYQVLMENNDGELEPTLENRRKVIRIIREFNPDVVLAPRLCDYHPDHRAAAQLVQDSAYMTHVPKCCPETPVPERRPVFAYVWDPFQDPRPFRADAVVDIDGSLDRKCRMMACHVSQFFEWLPWESGSMPDFAKMSWEEKKTYMLDLVGSYYGSVADKTRDVLAEIYGEAGKNVRNAEAFELSPYGRAVSVQQFRELMRP